MPNPIRVLMASIIALVVVSNGCAALSADTDVYALKQDGSDYPLVTRAAPDQTAARIPRQWLDYGGLTEEDEGCLDVTPVFADAVRAFAVTDRQTGLHLSSYRTPGPGDGSKQLACGQDVFLLIDRRDGRVMPTGLFPGVSKARARGLCSTARSTRFRIADNDGDGRTDIGVVIESLDCKVKTSADGERDEFETVHATGPIRWHRFDGDGWATDPRFDGKGADMGRRLPLIGIDKTPVDFVIEQEKRAMPSPVERCRECCDAVWAAACRNQSGVLESLCRRRADTDPRQCRVECTLGGGASGTPNAQTKKGRPPGDRPSRKLV